jgi:hypothetical protein
LISSAFSGVEKGLFVATRMVLLAVDMASSSNLKPLLPYSAHMARLQFAHGSRIFFFVAFSIVIDYAHFVNNP